MSNKKEEVKIETKVETKTEQESNTVNTQENRKEEIKKIVEKQFRRPDLQYEGRLIIDQKYKKPGKVVRVVSDKPGRIAYLESLGYSVVKDETKVGQGQLDVPNQLGSAVTVEAGLIKSCPSVLMEIDEDLYNERQKYKTKMNTELFEDSVSDNQRDDQRKERSGK